MHYGQHTQLRNNSEDQTRSGNTLHLVYWRPTSILFKYNLNKQKYLKKNASLCIVLYQ